MAQSLLIHATACKKIFFNQFKIHLLSILWFHLYYNGCHVEYLIYYMNSVHNASLPQIYNFYMNDIHDDARQHAESIQTIMTAVKRNRATLQTTLSLCRGNRVASKNRTLKEVKQIVALQRRFQLSEEVLINSLRPVVAKLTRRPLVDTLNAACIYCSK